MVLDTAKPKYKESTIWLGMRGRDAVRKSTLKVNILRVFTMDFSEIQFIVNHNSQSDGQTKVQRNGRTCKTKSHVPSIYKGILKRYQGQWYLTLNKSGENGLMRHRPDFRAAVFLTNRLHRESGEQVAEPFSPGQYRRWHLS